MAGLDRGSEVTQLVTDFYTRFMQVVLESRVPVPVPVSGDKPSSSSVHRTQCTAFNLIFGESCLPVAKLGLGSRGVWEPMAIDILYLQKGSLVTNGQKDVKKLTSQGSLKIALEPSGSEMAILLERWTIEFVGSDAASSTNVNKDRGVSLEKEIIGRHNKGVPRNEERITALRTGADYEATHIFVEKNLSILMRSLYSTIRLLPAHKLSRILGTRGKYKSRLACRVFTMPPPLSKSNKKEMILHCFPSADCCCGKLLMSVTYRQRVPMIEQRMPSFPPHIIMDYVDKYQLKQLPGKNVQRAHSLPSARCLPSSKASDVQLYQPLKTKEMALKEVQSWALVQPPDSLSADIDCPFAITDRKEAAKLYSVKSDVGSHCGQDPQDASSTSFLELLRRPEPLRRTRENLLKSHGSKQTVSDALRELKLYVNLKDSLLHNCT